MERRDAMAGQTLTPKKADLEFIAWYAQQHHVSKSYVARKMIECFCTHVASDRAIGEYLEMRERYDHHTARDARCDRAWQGRAIR